MSSNRILSRLSRKDFALLEPHLEALDLPVRKQLAARNKRVEHVYFPESGMMSVVANGEQAIEIGIIGREGMTGMSVAMGNDEKAPHEPTSRLQARVNGSQRADCGRQLMGAGRFAKLCCTMLTSS